MIVAEPVPFVIDHVPPAVASVNAGVAEFRQTEAAPPLIAGTVGTSFMVSGVVTVVVPQPLVTEYLTVADPAVRPVTTPLALMLAEPVPFWIDHVPPAVASVKAGVDALAHTDEAPPPMAATTGTSLTVSEVETVVVPQPLVTEYLTVTDPAVTPVTTPP